MDAVLDFIAGLPEAALTWLPLVFLGLIVYLIWRSLSLMPRVRPTEVEPSSKSSVTWADIAGVDEAAAELQEVVDFLKDPRRFSKLGARVPKGILIYGPPGTGKTLLAKAVAHASGSTFYSQSASAFVEMFAGLGAARIRKLFDRARKNAPAIVFIDELDAVGTRRTGSGFNREHDQTLNQLLVELDGFNHRDQIVIIGASNRLEDLDPALLRPGRRSAGSRSSSRFDAPMMTIWSRWLKPSSSTRSWFSVWSCSRLKPEPVRRVPTASSSSMNTIAGAFLRARSKSLRMRAAPRPANISTKLDALAA